jgi:hypothetical protein
MADVGPREIAAPDDPVAEVFVTRLSRHWDWLCDAVPGFPRRQLGAGYIKQHVSTVSHLHLFCSAGSLVISPSTKLLAVLEAEITLLAAGEALLMKRIPFGGLVQ